MAFQLLKKLFWGNEKVLRESAENGLSRVKTNTCDLWIVWHKVIAACLAVSQKS